MRVETKKNSFIVGKMCAAYNYVHYPNQLFDKYAMIDNIIREKKKWPKRNLTLKCSSNPAKISSLLPHFF